MKRAASAVAAVQGKQVLAGPVSSHEDYMLEEK